MGTLAEADIPPSNTFPWKKLILSVGLYVLATMFSVRAYPSFAEPVWFASGIGLAVLWLWGWRMAPAIFVGGFLSAFVMLERSPSLASNYFVWAGFFSLLHTGEVSLGYWGLQKAGVSAYPMRSLRDALLWVLLGSLLMPLLGSMGGMLGAGLFGLGSDFLHIVWVYWLSGVVAVMVVGTFLVVWFSPHTPADLRSLRSRALAISVVGGTTLFIFAGEYWFPVLHISPLAYLIAPMLIALAVFYGPRTTMLGMLFAAVCAIGFSLHGIGPLYAEDVETTIFYVQLYLGVVGSIVITLLGGVAQRMQAEQTLRYSMEVLQEQNRRFALLNTITTRALGTADEGALLQMLADNLGELWHASGCYITLWNESTQSVLPAAAYGPFREKYQSMTPALGEKTFTETLLRAGHPIFDADVLHSDNISPEIARQFPQKALLGIPLIAGGRWLGAVLIAFEEKQTITQDELAWAQQVGAQVALALEGVRLYTRALDGLRREQRMTSIGRLLAENLDLDVTLQRVTELMVDLVDADAGALGLVSEDGQYMTYPHVVGLPAHLTAGKVPRTGGGLAWRIVETGQPLLLDDYRKHVNALSEWKHQDIQAFLGAPIQSQEHFLGAIGLFRRPGRPAFSSQDVSQIAAVGRQAGLAIQNALLYRKEHVLRQRSEVLRSIALDMSTSHTLQDMLARLLERLQSIVPFDSSSVFLVDNADLRLVMARGVPDHENLLDALFPVDNPLFTEISRSMQPLALEDPQSHPGFEGWGGTQELKFWLGVPLLENGKVIGYITLDRFSGAAFEADDIALVEAVASQAAVLIARQRLHLQTEQRARELAVLYEFSRQFERQMDPEHIAQKACQLAVERLAATYAWVGLVPVGEIRLYAAGFHHREMTSPIHHLSQRAFPVAQTAFVHRVLRAGAPLVVESIRDEALLTAEDRQVFEGLGANRLIAFSLRHGGQVMGVLLLGDSGEQREFVERMRFLQSFANQVSVVLENARLFADTRRHLEYMQSLHTIDMTINASLDLDVTLSVLVRQLLNQLRVDAVAVFVLDSHTNLLSCRIGDGFHTISPTNERLRLGQGRAGKVALTRQPIYLPDLRSKPPSSAYTAALVHDEGFVSYYGTPLIAKGQVKGVLEIYNRTPLHPDALWMEFITAVAAQAAIAMDNAVLFQNLERSNFDLRMAYDTTLEGWSRALELRDAETEGHSERVTEMTLRLARTMGITGDKLTAIRYGALLHDIGKMGIPDRILYKPGPLTDEEWKIMRQHPVYAYTLLSPIPYLREALDIPYCHHERWQGQGYPRGLKGEQIPLAARIFAVVDVWDALSKDRPYRKAWPQEKVIQYLQEQAGIQFDPKIVEIFVRLLEEGA